MRRREVQISVDAEKLLDLFGFEHEDTQHMQITRMWIDDVRHCLNVAISSEYLEEVPPALEPPSVGVITQMDFMDPAEAFFSRYEKVEE